MSKQKKKSNQKNKRILLIASCLAVFVIGLILAILVLGGKDTEKKTRKKKTEVKSTNNVVVDTTPTTTSVLTGLPVSDEEKNIRPMAIMIENTKACLPQYGIGQASIVYECPTEGGIARLMGIYENYNNLDRLGNVRSCRPYYVHLAAEYHAVYVHFGQSTQGQEELDKGYVDELNGLSSVGGKVFYRTEDRKKPHNAYTSTSGLIAGLDAQGFEKTYQADDYKHFTFASQDALNTLSDGSPCAAVQLYFFDNKPYFTYDASTGLYSRFEYGQPQVDAITNTQLTYSNIILENVADSYYDDEHYRLNLQMEGSGTGKYLTQGKVIDITWKKDNATAITHYYDASGKEITLNPGKTWISVIQNSCADKNVFYGTIDEFNAR